MKQALLIVDPQNDFCPGGTMAVSDGDKIMPVINSVIPFFETVVVTRDFHPPGHISFAASHPGKKVYDTVSISGKEQILWPEHCVAGSRGAEFFPALSADRFSLVLSKGENPSMDSYSAFYENDRTTPTGLGGYFKERGIRGITACGLATDYCVLYSVIDALILGFTVTLLTDAVQAVNFPAGSAEKALKKMKDAGATLLSSREILNK